MMVFNDFVKKPDFLQRNRLNFLIVKFFTDFATKPDFLHQNRNFGRKVDFKGTAEI